MANGAMNTAGIKLFYCTESTAGTFPTTGFTEIADITDIPEYSAAPTGLDYTPIAETLAHKYIPGLIDGGSDWSVEMNITEDALDDWNDLVSAAATAWAAGKKTWFACVVPGFTNALYIAGLPATILWPGASVDEVFKATAHITVVDASKGWAAKFTG